MITAQSEYKRKLPSHATQNPCHLLGIMLIGAFAAMSTGQSLTYEPLHPIEKPNSSNMDTILVSQSPHDIVFKALLNALLQLFDEIIETRLTDSVFQATDSTLNETAGSLIGRYVAYGLDPTLSTQEISGGITDCNAALSMLKDTSIVLSLPQSKQDDLKITIGLISGELNSAF